MEGLYELTNALSNGTIPGPLRPPLILGVCTTPTKNYNRYYLRNGWSYTDFKFGWYVHRVNTYEPPKPI